jgi:hypothetical protein
MCELATIMHKSTVKMAFLETYANLVPEICPERAKDGVTPVTASPFGRSRK